MITLFLSLALALEPGTWRLDLEMVSEAKVPVLGWQHSVTHSVAVVHLDGDGTWTQQVCAVEIRDRNPMVHTWLPDAFIAALPVIVTRAETDGDTLTVDLGLSAVGWDPRIAGDLPSDRDDAAVVDHEGDGRPGATVQLQIRGVGTFGIDIVETSRAVLIGQRTDLGWAGTVQTLDLAQHVLDADHRMLRKTPELRPNNDDSRFILVPSPGATCASLRSAE